MLAMDFPGSRRLVEAIDHAVSQSCQHALTDELRVEDGDEGEYLNQIRALLKE